MCNKFVRSPSVFVLLVLNLVFTKTQVPSMAGPGFMFDLNVLRIWYSQDKQLVLSVLTFTCCATYYILQPHLMFCGTSDFVVQHII